MAWLTGLKNALKKLSEPEEPQLEGWPVNGLTAFYGSPFPLQSAPIKKIGSAGIYLGIHEPLPIGQFFALKLQKEGDPASSSELQITIEAQLIRQDEGGALMEFVPPPGLDPTEWGALVRDIAAFSNPDQVLEVFRTLRAILFLGRLCQSGAAEALHLLGGHLDQDRTATFFKILRSAEEMLAADSATGSLRAHPKLVASLLANGSWARDELITQMWVGLFAASCTVDEPDDSNQIFADLLVQITPSEARILTHACERALSSESATGGFNYAPVVVSAEEIVKLTGIYDLSRDATDLAYLFNLGLIQNVVNLSSFGGFDTFDITPSRIGVELYRRCHGKRGKIDPQLVEETKEHLAVFFPPPIPSAFENSKPLAPDPPQQAEEK